MNQKNWQRRAVTLLNAVLLSACSPSPTPPITLAANDINCAPDKLAALAERTVREDLSSRCFLRGQFKPSPKKEW